MKSLEQLYSDLKTLSDEFEQVLAAKAEAYDRRGNFAAIEAMSRKVPVVNDTLVRLVRPMQEQYLRLLCTVAGLDGSISVDQLLYLCRLAAGAGYEAGPQDLAVMTYQTDRLDWQAAALNLKKAALPLILDLLLTVHLGGRTPDQGLAFAAELAALLDVDSGDMEVCAQLAAALLTQDFEAFKCVGAKRPCSDLGYAVPEPWLERSRKMCGRYPVLETKRAELTARVAWRIYFGWNTPDAQVTAQEVQTAGSYVDAGCELVRFHSEFIPQKDSNGADIPFKKDDYILPQPDPIRARRGGIVCYADPADGEREVWVISPFDRL